MKTVCYLIVACLSLVCVNLSAQPQRSVSVTPVAHLISDALLAQTGVTVDFLAPARLPINRIPAWLKRVDATELMPADVVVTIESVWSSLELYPLMRSINVRSVPVDIASELAPGGARVLMRPGAELESDFFWLDLNNLTLMLNIASRDLVRMWPQHAEQIDLNRRSAQRAIQLSQIQIDQLLAEKPINAISIDDDRLMPLALSLSLPILPKSEGSDHLHLSIDAPSGDFPVWQVDTLQRLSVNSLSEWLEATENGLRDALGL